MKKRDICKKGRSWMVEGWEILRENGFVVRRENQRIPLCRAGALEWNVAGKTARVQLEDGMLFRPPHAEKLKLDLDNRPLQLVQREDRVFEIFEGQRKAGMLQGASGRAPQLQLEETFTAQEAAVLTALALAMLDCEDSFVM